MDEEGYRLRRERLVQTIRTTTGIVDQRILMAFAQVPRHHFLPPAQREHAYEDRAIVITQGQTISQPSMIAVMLAALALTPRHRVLEVGAGSGYAAALLATLAHEVYAVEVRPALYELARKNLEGARVANAHPVLGDGSLGLPEHAPYDRILVSAAARSIPSRLVDQLASDGRIAVPVGDGYSQELLIGTRTGGGSTTWETSIACVFVPLVSGEAGP
jgi:protein-L-isoaspartate(D-aspartate) O-methyltransferase